jgi:hypothetical protein
MISKPEEEESFFKWVPTLGEENNTATFRVEEVAEVKN